MFENIDHTVTGLKQGVDMVVPVIPVPLDPNAPPIVLALDDAAVFTVFLLRRGRFEQVFELSSEGGIVIKSDRLELHFAKGDSLALGRSRNMEPFQLYGTLRVETASGESRFSVDLYLPMEASFTMSETPQSLPVVTVQVPGAFIVVPAAPGPVTGNAVFVHEQPTPATTWTIANPWGVEPAAVTIKNSAGQIVGAEISESSASQIIVSFPAPYAGSAHVIKGI